MISLLDGFLLIGLSKLPNVVVSSGETYSATLWMSYSNVIAVKEQ